MFQYPLFYVPSPRLMSDNVLHQVPMHPETHKPAAFSERVPLSQNDYCTWCDQSASDLGNQCTLQDVGRISDLTLTGKGTLGSSSRSQ